VSSLKHDWQDKDYVLRLFGSNERQARKAYVSFVAKGIDQGYRPELIGGGLVRSLGGWSALKALRSEHIRVKGDERILVAQSLLKKIWKRQMSTSSRGPSA